MAEEHNAGPEVLAAIRARRSVRSFSDRPVPRELLVEMVAAAGWAPSSGNSQPWKFLVAEERGLIERLAREVEAAVARWLAQVTEEWREPFAAYASYFSLFRNAPVLIVPIYRPAQSWAACLAPEAMDWRARLEKRARTDALISVSLAVENLLLGAHALGLGACCMTGPLLAEEQIRLLLAVPPSWQLHSLIPVGYPEAVPPPPARRRLATVLQFLPTAPHES